jgi:hypothetical protein
MRIISILTALIIGLTVLIESDSQVEFGVEVVCSDESQACEDALEDLQGGIYE